VAGQAAGFFTHTGGIQAIAGNGPVSLQAHTDQLEILADGAVTVISVNDSIEIKAKEKIVLQAGQAAVTLEGGDITFACPGKFSVKGGQHLFDGGASRAVALARLPDSRAKIFKERFRAVDAASGKPIKNIPYKICLGDGNLITGFTDNDGKTAQVTTADPTTVKVFWNVNVEDEYDDNRINGSC
jgi:type VI secretion system secreted protein VgrG